MKVVVSLVAVLALGLGVVMLSCTGPNDPTEPANLMLVPSNENWVGTADTGKVILTNGDTIYPFHYWSASVVWDGNPGESSWVGGYWIDDNDTIGSFSGRRENLYGWINNGHWWVASTPTINGSWQGTWPLLRYRGDSANVSNGVWSCTNGGTGGGHYSGRGGHNYP
jgi:hypothetical protein